MTGLRDIAAQAAWGQLVTRGLRIGLPDPDLYADYTIDTVYGRRLIEANRQRLELAALPPLRRWSTRRRLRRQGRDLSHLLVDMEVL